MRRISLLIISALMATLSFAQQQNVSVHNSGNVLYGKALTSVDSIKLDNLYARIKPSDSSLNTINIQKVLIDSISFTTNAVTLTKIYIIYNGTEKATIINPYAAQGVQINSTGGAVTVTGASGLNNLEYNLLGTSTAGSLSMSSTTPATFIMNNLNITNANGPAINITGAQTHTFISQAGTTNSLTDGSGNTKNGTLQTDGRIILAGTGSLSIRGIKKHGISTTNFIEMQSSTVTVPAAASDALHSEGYAMSGGTVTVTTSVGDGIDAGDGAMTVTGGTVNVTSSSVDVKAFKTGNGTITIGGGTFNLNVSGNASKAVSAKGAITINDGTFNINLSGAPVLTASGSGFDPSYCSGIKSDGIITFNGGTIGIITTSAAAGAKGISANGAIVATNGIFNITTAGGSATYSNTSGVADSYSTTAFSSDADINVSGGTFTLVNSGAEGKQFSSDASVNVSGGTINITNSGAAGKGVNADANINITGGITTVNLSGATLFQSSGSGFNPSYPSAMKANKSITVTAGNITVIGNSAATGARGLSGDSSINVTGGTVTVSLAGNGTTYTNSTGGADSYSAAAFSSDTLINIIGGTVSTTSSGTGGKGLKSDGRIIIGNAGGNPTVNLATTGARFTVSGSGSTIDYNHPKTMVANGKIFIANGTITITSTDDGIHSDSAVTMSGGNLKVTASSTLSGAGEGVEAPIINFTGGVSHISASNDGINATYGTVVGGTEQNDNSEVNISGGIVIVSGSDAIDSNGNITISGGTTVVCGPTNQPEEGIDYNGTFLINGGTVIAAGSNANMTRAQSTASAQTGFFIKAGTASVLASTSILHIENAAGTEMVTFKPKNNVYYFHFSSPAVAQGSTYKIYYGGSYTGGSFVGNTGNTWGMYTGGTYSTTGATLKSTFTASSRVTTVTY